MKLDIRRRQKEGTREISRSDRKGERMRGKGDGAHISNANLKRNHIIHVLTCLLYRHALLFVFLLVVTVTI